MKKSKNRGKLLIFDIIDIVAAIVFVTLMGCFIIDLLFFR